MQNILAQQLHQNSPDDERMAMLSLQKAVLLVHDLQLEALIRGVDDLRRIPEATVIDWNKARTASKKLKK